MGSQGQRPGPHVDACCGFRLVTPRFIGKQDVRNMFYIDPGKPAAEVSQT